MVSRLFRRRDRVAAAVGAAAVAGADEWAFSEDHLVGVAMRCDRAIERARAARDIEQLARFVTPGLLQHLRVAWGRRDPAAGVGTVHTPTARLVTLANTRAEWGDRYVVEMAFVNGISPLSGRIRRADARELWTFLRADDRWLLAVIESARDGRHHWDDELLADDAADVAVAAEAAFELAEEDAVPAAALSAGLVGEDDADPARAVAELALLDERFARHVIRRVLERGTAAWSSSTEHGSSAPLLQFGSLSFAQALLRPDGVSGAIAVQRLSIVDEAIVALDSTDDPVMLTVEVTFRGRVAEWAGAGHRLARGSLRRNRTFALRWQLVVDDDRPGGWRLDAASPDWFTAAVGDA